MRESIPRSTRRTDRFARPGEYAAAGISYYWRIEQGPVHEYAYRLADRPGPTGERQYELAADSADLLELDSPFPIKLSIAEITPQRRYRPRPPGIQQPWPRRSYTRATG